MQSFNVVINTKIEVRFEPPVSKPGIVMDGTCRFLCLSFIGKNKLVSASSYKDIGTKQLGFVSLVPFSAPSKKSFKFPN